MKTRTATLLSIAGVLAASSVAAIVNAQVLDTGDDFRTPVPAAVTSTIAVDDTAGAPGATDPAATDDSAAPTGATLTPGSIAPTSGSEPTATPAADAAVPGGDAPLDPSPIAPLATTASGQAESPGVGATGPATTTACRLRCEPR